MFSAQAADGEILEEALFWLFETVMGCIEEALSVGDVEVIVGALLPGDGDQPIEVVADDRAFR